MVELTGNQQTTFKYITEWFQKSLEILMVHPQNSELKRSLLSLFNLLISFLFVKLNGSKYLGEKVLTHFFVQNSVL